MALLTDIEYQIQGLTEMYEGFIEYNDNIDITSENEEVYVISNTLLANTQKSTETAIQELQKQKSDSLITYELTLKQDSTLFNVCFEIYGTVTDEKFEQLIDLNDLMCFNRTDIDPLNPMLKKGMKILYYK